MAEEGEFKFRPMSRVRLMRCLPMALNLLLFKVVTRLQRILFRDRQRKLFFDLKMHLDPSEYVQKFIAFFGIWEPNISGLLVRLCRPGCIAVDIGAHVGYDTLLMASRVGTSGHIYAFEANPITFQKLKRNLALNGLSNVSPKNAAIMDTIGRFQLYSSGTSNIGTDSLLYGAGMTVTANVEGGPLSHYIDDEQRRQIAVIKIDVEGAEEQVILAMLSDATILEAKPHFIVEIGHPLAFEKSPAMKALSQNGYRAFTLKNEYGVKAYVDWDRVCTPTPCHRFPDEQTDFLFSAQNDSVSKTHEH